MTIPRPQEWTKAEVHQLRMLAKRKVSADSIAKSLGRYVGSVKTKARELNLILSRKLKVKNERSAQIENRLLKYALILIAAYLVTGAIYVGRKLTVKDYLRTPPLLMLYRSEGRTGRLIAATLGWLIATFINREFFYWLIFAILAAIGLYFSSI